MHRKLKAATAIITVLLMIFLMAGVALGDKPADNSKGGNGQGNQDPGRPHAPPSDDGSGDSGSGGTDSGGTDSGGTDSGSTSSTDTGSSSSGTDDGSGGSTSSSATASTSSASTTTATTSQAVVLPPCPATAPFGGVFEIDGDAFDNPLCTGQDWNVVDKTFVADKIGKAGDNSYFFRGGSKDIHDLSDWRNRVNDEAPDKDDITNAYSRAYIRNGDLIVVFGADRFANNGDSQMGFWFFQDKVSTNPNGTFDGLHRVGDILVLVDFTNGGEIRTIKAYKWVASGGDVDDNLDEVATGIDCSAATASTTVCGEVNQADAQAFWDYTPKDGVAGIFPTGSFFEGGINITALAPETECISSYLAETRTSQSPDARLKDFALGDFELCPSLLGSKFHDLNADGDRDSGEPTLAGWEIHLFGTTDRDVAVHLHTITDAAGAYSFALQPGTYTVCETIKPGWFQSFPTSGPDCSGHPGAGGVGYSVDLGLAVEATGKNFGNFQNATVQGFKFQDTNGNAVKDAVEPALQGWRIHVFGTTGAGVAIHLHTTTDALGVYGFSLVPGEYTLCEDILDGWTQSFPTSGPDCTAHGDGARGFGHRLTPTSGQTTPPSDFGNFRVEVLPFRLPPPEVKAKVLPITGLDNVVAWVFLAGVTILLGSLILASERRMRVRVRT